MPLFPRFSNRIKDKNRSIDDVERFSKNLCPQGDLNQILKMGGGGLLVTILGLLLLNGGFKAIITRRAIV